jgi:hypothetical protein
MCDTMQATSDGDDGGTAVTVVEEALLDDASSQPPDGFPALNEECKAAVGTDPAVSVVVSATPALLPLSAHTCIQSELQC